MRSPDKADKSVEQQHRKPKGKQSQPQSASLEDLKAKFGKKI
jgi:hypothetical protein